MNLLETAVKYKKPVAKKTASLVWGVVSRGLDARQKPAIGPTPEEIATRRATRETTIRNLASELIEHCSEFFGANSKEQQFKEFIGRPLAGTASAGIASLVGAEIKQQLKATGVAGYHFNWDATADVSGVGLPVQHGYNLPTRQFSPAGPTIVISRIAETIQARRHLHAVPDPPLIEVADIAA